MTDTQPAARTCVLVLGMHRSGTSAVARMINLMGAGLPKTLMGSSDSNEAGHWEPKTLVDLNDEMLLEGGSAWNDWRPFDPLTALRPDRFAHYRAEISRQIETEFAGETLFVLKDPRISRFTPLYLECLAELGIGVKVVLTWRHPIEVAGSLQKRDSMPRDYALRLWLRHDLEAEATTRGLNRTILSYDAALRDPDASISRLQALIGAATPEHAVVDLAGARASLRGDLRHHAWSAAETDPKTQLQDWAEAVESAYHRLAGDSADAGALASLDVLRGHINEDSNQNAETLAYALRDALRTRVELQDMTHQRGVLIERTRYLEAREIDLVEFEGRTRAELEDVMRQRNVMIERARQLETELDDMTRQRDIMIERARQVEAERDDTTRQRDTMIERTRYLEAREIELVQFEARTRAELDDMMRQRNVMIEHANQLEARETERDEREALNRAELADMTRQRNAMIRRTQELETNTRNSEVQRQLVETAAQQRDDRLSNVQSAFAERRRQHIIDLASTLHPDYGDKLPKQLWPWRSLNLQKRKRIRQLRQDYLTLLRSPLFDADYYLTQYPDVAASGQAPILHYLRYGSDEGRWPSASVDPVECRQFFPELKQSEGNLVLRLIALLGPITD